MEWRDKNIQISNKNHFCKSGLSMKRAIDVVCEFSCFPPPCWLCTEKKTTYPHHWRAHSFNSTKYKFTASNWKLNLCSALNAHSDMSYMHSMPLFKIHIVFKSNQSLIYNGNRWELVPRIRHKPFLPFNIKWNWKVKWKKKIREKNQITHILNETIVFLWNKFNSSWILTDPSWSNFSLRVFFFLFIERIVLVNSRTITQLLYGYHTSNVCVWFFFHFIYFLFLIFRVHTLYISIHSLPCAFVHAHSVEIFACTCVCVCVSHIKCLC